MATLTGFKSVGDSVQAVQPTNGAQQNPVFIFDEVESDKNEEFVDARSSVDNLQQQQNTTNKQHNKSDGTVSIEMTNKTVGHNTNNVAAAERGNKQNKQKSNNKSPSSSSTSSSSAASSSAPKSKSGNQSIQKAHSDVATTNIQSLGPNGADGDNKSVLSPSMLTIDCAGTGKSPRPCRSPLMALFRGKPRESSRRLYTDEDQFEIEWANLTLEVQQKWFQKFSLNNLLKSASDGDEPDKPQRPKKILDNVDGRIKSGEITAVLGPSGAGKTSLLNSLFGKYRTAVQGSIKVTGAPSKKHLTVCTIPQSDYLIGYLTTEESLWYASRLKNCEDDFDHDRNIERVIELLGLQRCRHTRINKLSGGQYKRVSIAQEMLSSPDILVLDEPTSGLDSLTCYRTVKVLRDLVEASKAHNLVNPMSIILTIHQPHREVLELFHSVYIMAVGGKTLYQGPPNEMEQCIDKFSGTSMPAQGFNPASFMVELASEEYGRKPIDSMVEHQRERFRSSTKHQYPKSSADSITKSASGLYSNSSSVSGGGSTKSGRSGKADSTITLYPLDNNKDKYVDVDLSGDSTGSGKHGNGGGYKDIDSRIMTPRSGKNSDGVFWRHVSMMSKRCFLSNNRDPLLCTMRIGAHIFIPLVVALIYGPKMGIPNGCPFYKPEINLLEYATIGVEEIEEKHDDIRIQFQNVGLHFMVYYAFGLCMLAFTAISFPLIMHVLIKEIRNGWYSLATFIIGKMVAELPMAILLPPISVGIIYTMTGQPSSYFEWRYCVQSLILILIIMIAEAKGLIFGALCMNSMQTAVFAASLSTVPFILLSGFLIRIREVPYILQHAAKFSYFKHAVEALILTRYGFGMCPCDPALIPAGGTPKIIGIPTQVMSLTDYYVNQFVASTGNSTSVDEPTTTTETNVVGNNRNIDRIMEAITSPAPEIDNSAGSEMSTTIAAETTTVASTMTILPSTAATVEPPQADGGNMTTESSSSRARRAAAASDEESEQPGASNESSEEERKPATQGVFFDKLATLLTRANAFGYSIQTCEDVAPFTLKDMQLKESMLPPLIGYLFLYIVILKFISYFIVEICVKLKL